MIARVAETVAAATAAGFGIASRLRGTKVFHPRGVVHEAIVRVEVNEVAPAGAAVLRTPTAHRALVRFSRSAGLPIRLPDVHGMAIRLLDAHGPDRHQDLLLVTSGDGAVVQHLLLPTRTFGGLPYSSLTAYAAGQERFIVGARRTGARGWRAEGALEQLAALAAGEEPAFDLCVAPVGGRLARIGSVTLGRRLAPDGNAIRFNPWNTGGGIRPATPLDRLRVAAYPGSQRGWEGAEPDSLSVES